jgi:hypothetical protein
MTFYNQLSQVFSYSGTLFNRLPGGTLLLRRLQIVRNKIVADKGINVERVNP